MISARDKIYKEGETPVGERIYLLTDVCPQSEKDTQFYLANFKNLIFRDVYPRRPVPKTCTLSVSMGEKDFEFAIEFVCSPAMKLDDYLDKVWLFDNTVETLQVVSELLNYIPEIMEILKAN